MFLLYFVVNLLFMFVDNMILFLIDERKVIMIVIKRDGQEVNYNRSKIIVAIGKANEEVPEEERISNRRLKRLFLMWRLEREREFLLKTFRISSSRN